MGIFVETVPINQLFSLFCKIPSSFHVSRRLKSSVCQKYLKVEVTFKTTCIFLPLFSRTSFHISSEWNSSTFVIFLIILSYVNIAKHNVFSYYFSLFLSPYYYMRINVNAKYLSNRVILLVIYTTKPAAFSEQIFKVWKVRLIRS